MKIDYVNEEQRKNEKREFKRMKRLEKETERKLELWRNSKAYKDHFSGKAYKNKDNK